MASGMSSPYSIHEPSTLFTLPQPIDQTLGKTRAGPAYSINGSRKRKRAEVVISVDGECLNIYNIEIPRLLNTHAVPPQTYLTAPPSCTLSKPFDTHPAQRFIYAATRNDFAGKPPELLCIREQLDPTTSNPPQRSMHEVSVRSSEIMYIEPISARLLPTSGETDPHQVLVVHKSGDITIFSADLQVERGRGRPESSVLDTEEHEVELVASSTSEIARKSLLAGRPDLAAGLDQADTVILLVTTPKSSERQHDNVKICHVVSIQPSRFGSTSQTAIHTLVSWPLTTSGISNDHNSKKLQLAYSEEFAWLYQLCQDSVSAWDLTASTPRTVSQFRTYSSHNCHLLPVSSSTLLVASANECVLYDLIYGAVQASQKTGGSDSTVGGSKKRKRSDQRVDYSHIMPIQFFPAIGGCICLAGSDLVSLSISVNTRRNIRHKEGRLIDSLGRSRAMASYNDSSSLTNGEINDNVKTAHAELSKNSTEQNVQEFDRIFMDFVNEQPPYEARELALRAMSLIFEWNRASAPDPRSPNAKTSSIRLNSAPKQSLEWMAEIGLLTPQNISKAILASNGSNGGHPASISESDMILAAAQADHSLNLLAALLECLKLGLSGYIESFRVLMESFHTPQPLAGNHRIENGAEQELTNGTTEQQLLFEESAAAQELQLATSLLEGEFDGRGTALKICIERLGTNFSASELVQALRHQLSHQGIFMLVEILRIELDQAGWTSRRLDFHPSQDATENQNEAIAVICKLLNCALDAIGTGGWLSRNASSDDDDIDSVISLLRADTTAVLEGVQESTFFSSFLKDFIRFEETLNQSKHGEQRQWSMNEPPQLFKSMLPLGVKSAQKEALTRVGAGGEIQKRSVRKRAMESSQKIGKYTFETIRI